MGGSRRRRSVPGPGSLSALALLAAGLALPSCDRPPVEGEGPRLVVFLVVDQMRADYLDRYRPVLRHGIGRLLAEGVRFTEAFHEHAVPTTAPGHATLISGRFPRHHGIIGNAWTERGSRLEVEAVEDDAVGVSPRRLRVSTLGDWLKAVDRRSRVLAVSAKDRSAVLLGGHRADGAYWYDEDVGRWVTSEHYPAGARDFLAREPERWSADRHFGRLWEPLDAAALAALPGVAPVDLGVVDAGFPHAIGDPTPAPEEEFWDDFYDSPFTDEVVEEMGETLVRHFALGADDTTDLLALSFSALDTVGHRYGPDSPELLDTLMRVDRRIGRLLDFLDAEVGLDRLLVSLSADHGVLPVPEVAIARGEGGGRLAGEDAACLQRLGEELSRRHGEDRWLRPGPFIEEATLARRGVARAVLEAESRELLERCPAVARVWTRGELVAAGDGDGSPDERLFVRAFDPERSPDLLVQLEPGWVAWTDDATTHLSVYEDDRHVPWIVRLPAGTAATVATPVATADVAPTLAEVVGVGTPPELDGASRAALLRPPKASHQSPSPGR
jgi:arylsulfatase A-like enzyme